MKSLFSLVFALLLTLPLSAQSNWSIRTTLGIGSEQNLGDFGVRFGNRLARHYNRVNGFVQWETFQMLTTNEDNLKHFPYDEMRSLSTTQLNLGMGLNLIHRPKVRIGLDLAGSYRFGRQLWPERAQVINGDQEIFYTYEKIRQLGVAVGAELGIKISQKVWFNADIHSHNYGFIGEYVGIGLGATL
ncbi:MAG: hypothetical protein IT261_03165, partial [Saprospiraceae bacterium]|nr:hypothetical protein [Saprospiraceae bacterium]